MIESRHYDVIVVGSGAGGATLAHRLADTGKRVLVLERGDWLPREAENWNSREVFGQARYAANEIFRDHNGKDFKPSLHYRVGGNTKVYGAALFRLRESDFCETVHADGISPAWPLHYADFSPYYLEAEHLYGVHGERGADPSEPPEAAPYPHAALAHEPLIEQLASDLKGIGSKPFPLPMALRYNAADSLRSPCIRCATCDGFPCLLNAKSDADTTCMRPAIAAGNVELLINAYVEGLETSASGREITAVRVQHDGQTLRFKANVVVVSAGAINSAALLLRSANTRHPQGLANGSGVIGRHYMCHHNSAFMAITASRNPTRFQKTLGINDFYHGERGAPGLGHIQMLGKTDGGILSAQAPGVVPIALLDAVANHSVDFWLMSEDLPSTENRVTLDGDGTIRLSRRALNESAHSELDSRFRALLRRAQPKPVLRAFLSQRIALSGVAHQCGTIRFGKDGAASALDINCRAHEVDNLYVVDSSFFPSSGAVNPTLTIIANALRVGDILRSRLS